MLGWLPRGMLGDLDLQTPWRPIAVSLIHFFVRRGEFHVIGILLFWWIFPGEDFVSPWSAASLSVCLRGVLFISMGFLVRGGLRYQPVNVFYYLCKYLDLRDLTFYFSNNSSWNFFFQFYPAHSPNGLSGLRWPAL